jgi:glutamate--cysteine ligase
MSQVISLQPPTMSSGATLPPILDQFRQLFATRAEDIERWMETKRSSVGAPFYSSVDIRHAGFKLAPVDTNLFPAGFNKLSAAARIRAAERFAVRLAEHEIAAKRLLIIPENHTRNIGYLDNLVALRDILIAAGAEVRIGSLLATPDQPIEVAGSDGIAFHEIALMRDGTMLSTADGFTPDLIVLNNDLTTRMPDILRGVSQPIVPRPAQGWHRRRKTIYFEAYDRLAREFAADFALDPWAITTEFQKCGHVNFGEKQGLDCVALNVEKTLYKIRQHYARYGIVDEPYVYVKSDSGTYGMGIMTVRSGDEVIEINKKNRNKMNVIKEGVQSTEVIIQEGVPTIDRVDGAPAEPMVYAVDGFAVGGAYRVNDQRDALNNLNATGMRFVGMCDAAEEGQAQVAMPDCSFGALGLIASLASLAARGEEYGEGYSI